VDLIIIGVRDLPDNGTAIKVESSFYRIKLAFAALVMFIVLGFTSSYLEMDNSTMWFDLAKITLGFLFGNGIAIGYSK